MYLFARVYQHFYDEITEAFIELINEYGMGEKEIDIGYIIKTYNLDNAFFIDTIKCNEITNISSDGHPITQGTVKFKKGKTVYDIREIPLDNLIQLYDITVFYLLCIEYGVSANLTKTKEENQSIILNMMEKDFINSTKADVPVMKSTGITENTSTINYILQALSLMQTGKQFNLDDSEINELQEQEEDISDMMSITIQMKKENNKYFFNVKNHVFDVNIHCDSLSICELLTLYDTIIKNKEKTH